MVKSDKYIGVSQLLGDTCPGCPQSLLLCVAKWLIGVVIQMGVPASKCDPGMTHSLIRPI